MSTPSSPCSGSESEGADPQPRLKRRADFLFEVGMLRKTPRTGYQFLGSGAENVAEHSHRVAVIGWMLALEAGANVEKTLLLCLTHDLHEARTGDFNYVNRMYNTCDRVAALKDAAVGTGLTVAILDLHHELETADSLEAQLAQDADQIDLIANLKEELELGNQRAKDWIDCALKRLRTPQGAALATAVAETTATDWWFKRPDPSWWAKKNGRG